MEKAPFCLSFQVTRLSSFVDLVFSNWGCNTKKNSSLLNALPKHPYIIPTYRMSLFHTSVKFTLE